MAWVLPASCEQCQAASEKKLSSFGEGWCLKLSVQAMLSLESALPSAMGANSLQCLSFLTGGGGSAASLPAHTEGSQQVAE